MGILRPGTYRINTKLFIVTKATAIRIAENTIGIAIAKDGIPLPPGYIIAPKAVNDDGTEVDHKFYQNGQLFIEARDTAVRNWIRYSREYIISILYYSISKPNM